MLEAEADRIDAVYCGTPDHSHAVITLAALKRKKQGSGADGRLRAWMHSHEHTGPA